MRFVFYLAFVMAAAGDRGLGQPAQSQAQDRQSVHSKLSESDVPQLRTRAEAGDASAQFDLGEAYEEGNGVSQNDALAATWYRKAARLGNPQAMFNLGVSYYNGDGVPSNPTSAYAWFLSAEDAGNSAAQDAVRRRTEEAGRMGPADAFQQIAAMYETGDVLPQNYVEAIKWYRKAADLSSKAGVKLASIFIDGKGVAPDYGQAMTLCRNAAKQNYPAGIYCVGYLYERGLGTQVASKEAAKWYAEASKDGNGPSMMALGEMYWKGDGRGIDRPEAYYFFPRAYQRGMPNAKTRAQAVMKEMSKDDVKHLERKLIERHLDPQKVRAIMQEPTTPDVTQ
jgi:TPR repeat protein